MIERDAVLHKARHNEAAAHLTEWLTSPGLKSPPEQGNRLC